MKLIHLLSLAGIFASCNANENNTEKTTTQPVQIKEEPSPVNCYRYANANDTITLKLIHVGSSITGTLVYSLKEKDKNTGTIQGAMKGDMLLADYTFMSEGVQSIRQVAFKMEGNTFREGYGDIVHKDEKAYFKNTDSLIFNTAMKLVEVACQ